MKLVRKICKPWLIVLIGVVMTIASAIVSHSLIMKNNTTIQTLTKESQQIDQTITNRWLDMGRFERDGNTVLLMATMLDQNPGVMPSQEMVNNLKLYARHFIQNSDAKTERFNVETVLQAITPLEGRAALFPAVSSLVEAERSLVVQQVDDLYIKKVSLEDNIQKLDAENTTHTSTALFLQILGLIFVLSKDLARREWPK